MANEDRKLLLETKAAKILQSLLADIADDPETRRDTIEGETNLHEAIHGVLMAITDDEMMVDGMASHIAVMQNRKARLEARIEKRRKAILMAMEAGEVQKLTYPEATVSTRVDQAKLIITDERLIPPQFFEPQEPKLNKTKLKAALSNSESAQQINGASLSNGGLGLNIRRS